MSAYVVISDREVAGRTAGDQLTDEEITAAGGDAGHLIEAGHIAPTNPTPNQAEKANTPKE